MSNTYYKRPNNSGKNINYQTSRYPNNSRQIVVKYSSTKDLITNIILVLLSISLVIAILTLGAELSGIDNYYDKDANSFWWAYDSGNYVDSIRDRYENTYNGIRETAELKQCYAVSEYYEAATLYKAAVYTGKEDKAMKYLEIMAKAYSEMGDVSYLAEDIDTKLGIADIVK